MPDDVTSWLQELGLGDYAGVFDENDIDRDLLPELDHQTLKDIGISSAGHRLRIIKAARVMRSAPDVPIPDEAPSTRGSGPETARVDAERRQLTIMFCDLVGSTELSGRLDPEDLRAVNRAYQDACKRAIERYDGYVARYMGDGVLAYFGYPQAHEDDAERAIHAGLAVVEAMGGLHAMVGRDESIALAVRVGIATGPVVVGDLIGEGAAQESAVVGVTPNLASRLQSLAAPSSVVVSPLTRELAAGRFEYADLGCHELKGIAEPVRAWQAAVPVVVESRFDALHTAGLTPLVGREHELGLLLERWEQARDGDGQVVLLSGEAGIGKSRVVQALCSASAVDEPIRLRYQCSAYHGNSALYPVIEQLARAARLDSADPPALKIDKLESLLRQATPAVEDVAPLLAALLSIPAEEHYAALDVSPERQMEETLDALVAQMEGLARRRPVLLIFEDAQWADPTSIELLDRIVARASHARVLVLVTFRPDFSPPWRDHAHMTPLTLSRLSRVLVNRLTEKVTGGKPLPDELRDHILDKTDGVPLFVEELTKAVLESNLVDETAQAFVLTGPLSALAIPSTLHDSLMARLDRLSAVKGVAQTAAAIGREFPYEMLAAVSPLDDKALEAAVEELIRAELVLHSGHPSRKSYVFKHALVQDAAYESLLKSTRRNLHERIAKVLTEDFPERAVTEPELLARHLTCAGLAEPAVGYWYRAGRRAMDRSADREAVGHLRQGLAVLESLPASAERDARELDLQIALFRALTTTRGWGSVDATESHDRARELCERSGGPDQLLAVLVGERIRHWRNARYREGIEATERIVRLARQRDDALQVLFGRLMAQWPYLGLGELETLGTATDDVLETYDRHKQRAFAYYYGLDLRVVALGLRGYQQSLCGVLDQAAESGAAAVAWARELNHAGSLVWALSWAGAQPAAMRGDARAAGTFANEVLAMPEKRRSPVDLAWGRVFAGWSIGKSGQLAQGVALLREGLAYLVAEGVKMLRSVHVALLIDLYLDAGALDDASQALEEAEHHMAQAQERLWAAEIRRLRGALLLAQGSENAEEAGRCFEQAIQLAQGQGAKLLERRAATSLARIRQGKRGHAYFSIGRSRGRPRPIEK